MYCFNNRVTSLVYIKSKKELNMDHLKKMCNNGKAIFRKNNSDFMNLNDMYVYWILLQASVCNSQAACYILALLETII